MKFKELFARPSSSTRVHGGAHATELSESGARVPATQASAKSTSSSDGDKPVAYAASALLLASVSHEARSSLLNILGNSDMLLATNENISQDARDSISTIVKSSQYLLRLVELTRLLANLDRRRVELTHSPVNINEVLFETQQRVEDVTCGKTVSVSINSPVAHGWFLCDAKALTTILDSIIELVSRHTPTPGTLKVTLNVQLGPTGFSTGQCCVDIRITRANDARSADTFQHFLTDASREESLMLPPSFEFILLSVASKLATLHGGSIKSVAQAAESGLMLTLPTVQSVPTPAQSPASTAPSTPKSTHSSSRLPGISAQQSNGRLLAPPAADAGVPRTMRRSSTGGAAMMPLHKSPSLAAGDLPKGTTGSGTTARSDSSSNGSSALASGASNLAVKANGGGAPKTMGMSRSDSATPAMRPRRSSSPAAPPKKKTVVPSVIVEPVSIESTTSDSGNGSDIVRGSRASGMQRSISLRPLDEYHPTNASAPETKREAGMPPDCQLVKPKTAEQRHLLVVEDDVANQRMIRTMLTRLGYTQVTFAADGADALFQYNNMKLDGRFFDLILLDSSLPTLPGDDTCVRIRQHDRTQVIISCTASTHLVNDPELRRALGYDEAMTKPFYLDGLKDVLARWCELGDARRLRHIKRKLRGDAAAAAGATAVPVPGMVRHGSIASS